MTGSDSPRHKERFCHLPHGQEALDLSCLTRGQCLQKQRHYLCYSGSTAVMNTMTRSSCRGKGLDQLTALRSNPIPEESRQGLKSGAWRQEIKQKPWRSVLYMFASHVFLSLNSYALQDSLPRGSTGVDTPTSTITQENTLTNDIILKSNDIIYIKSLAYRPFPKHILSSFFLGKARFVSY